MIGWPHNKSPIIKTTGFNVTELYVIKQGDKKILKYLTGGTNPGTSWKIWKIENRKNWKFWKFRWESIHFGQRSSWVTPDTTVSDRPIWSIRSSCFLLFALCCSVLCARCVLCAVCCVLWNGCHHPICQYAFKHLLTIYIANCHLSRSEERRVGKECV